MQVIIISYPTIFPNEVEIVKSLFEEGLQMFHLRKPSYSYEEMEQFILQIPEKYLSKIVIHSHYSLVTKYKLKGAHFSLANFENQVCKYSISASFHSIDEIINHGMFFNYVFISPIFDSISKVGYKSSICVNDLNIYLNQKSSRTTVFALGGVDEDKIEVLKHLGFDGFALLGAIWNEENQLGEIIKKFRSIIKNSSKL